MKLINKSLVVVVFAVTILSACVQTSGNPGSLAGTNEDSEFVNDSSSPKRLSISEVSKDGAMLASLRQAIAVMRENGNADPGSVDYVNSLQFWANTHGFIGDPNQDPHATDFLRTVVRRSGTCVNRYKAFLGSETKAIDVCTNIFRQVETPFETNELTEGIWGTCQHTAYTPEYASTPRFLPWHRLYLYYFDRTLRKVSNNPELALPYWDYFDDLATPLVSSNKYSSQSTQYIALPPVVASEKISEQAEAPLNSLFDPLRSFGLNERKNLIDPVIANAEDAFAHTEFVEFSNELEDAPHGAMHCAVGEGCSIPHMGWVPLAGNDPLFYMHHANIDRLWQCWLNEKAQGEQITLEWAKQNLGMPDSWYKVSYNFVDENGKRITKTIADAFSPEVLAVRYATETNCQLDIKGYSSTRAFARASGAQDEVRKQAEIYSSEKVILQPYDVDIPLEKLVDNSKTQSLLAEYEGRTGIWVILENVEVNEMPYFNFDVLVSNKNTPEKKESVGVFNFFGFGGHHGSHSAHHNLEKSGNSMGNLDYLISDDLSKLGFTNIDDVQVTIRPQSYTSGTKISQDNINIIDIDAVYILALP